MEDVLAIYEKPLSDKEPVVCVDEKPVVLHADVRPPRPMRRDGLPGAIASTSDAARPMSSAASSPRRPGTLPSRPPTALRCSSPITCGDRGQLSRGPHHPSGDG
jgi:hypothetical protein